jgi:thymidine kinase
LYPFFSVVIRHKWDDRYSEELLATHDKNMMKAVSSSALFDCSKICENASVIGVDEGQFFPDLLDFCDLQANSGKVVIVAALDGTFQRKAFNKVCDLIPMAEVVDKLNAICSFCGKTASFSKRIVDNTEIELVGGAETYTATCRKCFFLHNKSQTTSIHQTEKQIINDDVQNSPDEKKTIANFNSPVYFPHDE